MAADQTLLHTDIVDSTAVNHRVGDAAMAALWRAHDQASRVLLSAWRGLEIDRSDGFLLLFDTPRDAAGFAADYHRMLAELPVPLRARAAIHTGPVQRLDNTPGDVARGAKPVEVLGIAKAVSARLMGLAQGGQTLASPSTAAQLAVSAWHCRSHGHWRLKGLQDPVEVFEISGANPTVFTPPQDTDKGQRVVQVNDQWIPARQVPHNLPAERDGFVGRRGDLQALGDGFESGARLLTILGPGGMGKTRLALRYSWAWQGDFPGGVWFCDLAQARSLDGTLQALAQTLEVSLGNDAVAQLGRAIAGRERCLLILDNFEQITAHAAATLGAWLDAAPMARFIVTTRERLGLPGETTLALEPLDNADGVALFHSRARAANADYVADEANEQAVHALVALLDGLPLAIELAAPRVRVMSPAQLLARMGDRFRLLASPQGRPDRQATLRATLAWSWDLLSPPERAALAQCSVFEGGFDWAAADAVLDLSACADAPWLLDVVQSLVDKSLLRVPSSGRFGMMASVQAFASEQLHLDGGFPGSGKVMEALTEERHQSHYAGLGEAAATAHRCVELDNLARACRRAVAAGHTGDASKCLRLAWAALRLTGPFGLGLKLAAEVRALPVLDGAALAGLEWVTACALQMLGQHEPALQHALRGLAADPHREDLVLQARLRCAIGDSAVALGQDGLATDSLAEAVHWARKAGDPPTLCQALNACGARAADLGQLAEARAAYAEALCTAERAQDTRWQGGLLGNLGLLEYLEGRLDEACALYERALSMAQDTGDRRWEGNTRCNLGLIFHEKGRSTEARSELIRALAMARNLGHRQLEYTVQCNLGIVCTALKHDSEALSHFEAAVAGSRACGDRRAEGQFRGYLGLALARTGNHDAARDCLQQGRELLRKADDVVGQGMLLCHAAEAASLAGAVDDAREAIQSARGFLLNDASNGRDELRRRIEALSLNLG